MANFLYKVGSFAARKAWAIIAIWVVILAALIGSYSAFHGDLSDEVSIPGTEAMQVQEQLQEVFNMNTNSANSQVIVQTNNGETFSQEQKEALAKALTQVDGVQGVTSTTDPFATQAQIDNGLSELNKAQAQLDEQAAPLEDAGAQLAAAQEKLNETRSRFDSNQAPQEAWDQVNQAQQELDDQRKQLEESGAPAEAFAQLDAAQGQIDQQKEQLNNFSPTPEMWDELNNGQAQLDQQRAQFESGKEQAEQGQASIDQNLALLELTQGASMISSSGNTAIATVIFENEVGSVPETTLEETRNDLSSLKDSGLTVHFDQNMETQVPELGVTAEIIGIIVAFIILVLMLGSLVAAGLPILMALVGVGSAAMGTLALSSLIDMSSTTLALGTMLGLAVGIDYTLFILNRHRSNLAQGMEMRHSIGMAVGTSGSAVAFAGITVIIALVALNVVGIPFLGVMGNAAAFSVLMAVCVALTLAPAVLSLVGPRVMSKKRWAKIQERKTHENDYTEDVRQAASLAASEKEAKQSGWLKFILAKPWLTIVGAVLALILLALPVGSMRLGLPTAESESSDSAAYQTYQLISEEFGEGRNGMIIAAAELPAGTTAEQAKTLQVEVGQDLLAQENVSTVVPALISEDNSTLLYQIIPAEGPNAESTEKLVHSLRDLKLATDAGEISLGVTGQTAMAIDIAQNLAQVLPVYIAIVMGLSLIVLVLVFRSILVPLTATLGFLFSLLAALGVTTAVFQWGWLAGIFGVQTPAPLLAFLPILAVGILFGLAMDYQMFLVSGMREAYAHGKGAKRSVAIGYNNNAKVVVAAALIMAGVFLGFVFSGNPMISSIGFVLAAGVLFDAFVVRMTLIPALMHILGEKAWWFPRWMQRAIPDLDVEGTKLEEKFGVSGPQPAEGKTSQAGSQDAAQEQAIRATLAAAEAATLAAREAATSAREAALAANRAAAAAESAAAALKKD